VEYPAIKHGVYEFHYWPLNAQFTSDSRWGGVVEGAGSQVVCRYFVRIQHFQRHCRKCPSTQTPLVSWDPSAFIVLVDNSNDLPILYHFRKGPRQSTDVGCLGLLARLLLLLVFRAMSKSGTAHRECYLSVMRRLVSWFLHYDSATAHISLVLRDHFPKNSTLSSETTASA